MNDDPLLTLVLHDAPSHTVVTIAIGNCEDWLREETPEMADIVKNGALKVKMRWNVCTFKAESTK